MQKLRRVIASLSMVAILSTLVVSTTAMAGLYYDDVPTNEWYAQYVDEMAAGGYLGTTGGKFNPATDLTRADAAAWLTGLAGLESEAGEPTFKDVPKTHPQFAAVEAAAAHGVVSGYSGDKAGYFGPNDPITREQYAKMAVEAFELPLVEDCSMFTDASTINDWACEYVATAYAWSVLDGYPDGSFGPGKNINRAEGAKVTLNSSSPVLREETPVDPPVDPVDPVDPPVVQGDLTVSVASSTPDESFVPMNGFEVPYTTLAFSAEDSDEDVKVTQLVVTRTGLGSTSNFSQVRLYQGNKQLGGDKTFSSATNTATFNLLSTPLVVPAGSVVEVMVTGDMAGSSTSNLSGARNMLGLASADAVVANATVGGSYPMYGEAMQLSNSLVGTLDIIHTQVSGGVEVGDVDEVLGRVRLAAGSSEDVAISMLRYKQTGSATGSKDLANLKLWNGGDLIAENPEWDGDYAVFDFSDTPVSLKKGNDINLVLRGDIVGGIANTVGFEIKETKDVVAYGKVLGFRVNVTETNGTTPASSFTPTARSITGGVLNFSLSSDNPPSQDIADGGDKVEFMRFNAVTGGDAVRIEDFGLTLTSVTGVPSEITNIAVYSVNEDGTLGSTIVGPLDADLTTVGTDLLAFTEDWELPANATSKFAVVADVENTVTAGDTFTFALDYSALSAEFVSSSDTLVSTDISPTSDVTGSTMTVASPTLTIAVASSPQDQTVVKNSKDVKFAAFTFGANTVSDITVTSLMLTMKTSGSGATAGTSEDATNIRVYEDNKGVLTKLTQTKEFTTSETVTFSSINYKVKAGDTVKLVVMGDIPSSATSGRIFSVGIAALTDVTTQDDKGLSGTVAGASRNTAGTTADVEVTIAASGTLTAALDGDTPSSMVLSTNSDLVLATIVQFSAKNESFEVTKFEMNTNGNGGDEVESITAEYQNKAGETVTKTQPVTSAGVASFSGQSLWVPKNKDADVKFYVNTASEAEGADSGDTVDVDLDFDTNFEAFGDGSNTRATSVGSANVAGNNHTIYASDLLVAVSADTPKSSDVTAGTGQEVFKVDFKAVGENTPSINALAFTSSGTVVLSSATGSATLLDKNGDTEATEAYVTAASAATGGSTSTFKPGTAADTNGMPVGATVLLYDAAGGSGTTAVRITAVAATTGIVTFTPAVTDYGFDSTSDTLTYAPLQPGTGKLYFGAMSTLGANVVDTTSTGLTVASTNGFAVGDVVASRGATSAGVVIECTGTITAITSTTSITTSAQSCTSSGTIVYNQGITAKPGQTAVAFVSLSGATPYVPEIAEEITGTEYMIVKGDLTGASPSTTGTRTVQLRLNAASDVVWDDDMPDLADDVDNADENTSFMINNNNLNKEKDGYNNFPLNGNALEFKT